MRIGDERSGVKGGITGRQFPPDKVGEVQKISITLPRGIAETFSLCQSPSGNIALQSEELVR